MLVLPLHDKHNRKGFDCGDTTLNGWLQQTARQHQQKGVSATFIAAANTPVLKFAASMPSALPSW